MYLKLNGLVTTRCRVWTSFARPTHLHTVFLKLHWGMEIDLSCCTLSSSWEARIGRKTTLIKLLTRVKWDEKVGGQSTAIFSFKTCVVTNYYIGTDSSFDTCQVALYFHLILPDAVSVPTSAIFNCRTVVGAVEIKEMKGWSDFLIQKHKKSR